MYEVAPSAPVQDTTNELYVIESAVTLMAVGGLSVVLTTIGV